MTVGRIVGEHRDGAGWPYYTVVSGDQILTYVYTLWLDPEVPLEGWVVLMPGIRNALGSNHDKIIRAATLAEVVQHHRERSTCQNS